MAERKIIVVKIGTSTLVGDDARSDRAYLDSLAEQLAELHSAGWAPIVVTSGAIAYGMEVLGLKERPADIPGLQAAASVGQVELSRAYADSLARVGMKSSLVLLTRHDTASRSAYLHARDALERLIELDVVPIVNENDTTSVEQIRFGDNDTLAALVACLVRAQLCVIFSDVDGLYNGDPSDAASCRLENVGRITPEILGVAGGVGSSLGSGGMLTKVRSARVLMIAGIPLIICHGREARALPRIVDGEAIGTRFAASDVPHEITNYKLWIALGDTAKGELVCDGGAKAALIEGGSSLLAVGVKRAQGSFDAGDIVDILDEDGYLFARGKVQASSDEIALAAGHSQAELKANAVLSHLGEHELIHRDELVVFE
ncbi:MAG: glutamate 5-kinase [Eggerthellaceae bacterium]|nr:glutamate 5-kinase [Eggerthellaceae bacterium]